MGNSFLMLPQGDIDDYLYALDTLALAKRMMEEGMAVDMDWTYHSPVHLWFMKQVFGEEYFSEQNDGYFITCPLTEEGITQINEFVNEGETFWHDYAYEGISFEVKESGVFFEYPPGYYAMYPKFDEFLELGELIKTLRLEGIKEDDK